MDQVEKKLKHTIENLPPFDGDISKIPKVTKVSLATRNAKWHLCFNLSSLFTWVVSIEESSEQGRKQIASLFGIEPEETNIKLRGNFGDNDTFKLYNIEGKVILALHVWANTGGDRDPNGIQFVCDLPNPDAIPEKSLKESYISFKCHFPKDAKKSSNAY